jgi:hypothetical protein
MPASSQRLRLDVFEPRLELLLSYISAACSATQVKQTTHHPISTPKPAILSTRVCCAWWHSTYIHSVINPVKVPVSLAVSFCRLLSHLMKCACFLPSVCLSQREQACALRSTVLCTGSPLPRPNVAPTALPQAQFDNPNHLHQQTCTTTQTLGHLTPT